MQLIEIERGDAVTVKIGYKTQSVHAMLTLYSDTLGITIRGHGEFLISWDIIDDLRSNPSGEAA